MKCCVVIPIYKEKLKETEIKSLSIVSKILGSHEIFFVTHKELNLESYHQVLNHNFQVKYFKKDYFRSISSYNKLMLSSKFYTAFKTFDYMLIYQLDAYVFRDELYNWCNKNYDYIGAPWLSNKLRDNFLAGFKTSRNPLRRLVKYLVGFYSPCNNSVGNGGFSLRKVSTFRRISKFIKIIEPNVFKYESNEDVIWSFLVPKYFKNFKLPSFEEALKFSVDQNPKEAFDILDNEIPFGCHAKEWEDYLFWEKHLP